MSETRGAYEVLRNEPPHRCALPTRRGRGGGDGFHDGAVIRCQACGQHWRKGTPGFDYEWTQITDAQAKDAS